MGKHSDKGQKHTGADESWAKTLKSWNTDKETPEWPKEDPDKEKK